MNTKKMLTFVTVMTCVLLGASALHANAQAAPQEVDSQPPVTPEEVEEELGTGDVHPYHLVEGWAQLPEGMEWGEVISVDLDAEGNLYVFHRAEPPILKFDPSGKLLESWGEEMFMTPHGFHVDQDGFLWAVDQGSHQVFKFSPDGPLLLTLGKKGVAGEGPDTFNGPTDVTVAANGDIFVTDGHGNARVVRFSKDGQFIKTWGRKGAGLGEFDLPHTIAIDTRGRVFVGDLANHRIQIFDPEGRFLDQWTQFGWPSGMAITNDDTVYVADHTSKKGITVGRARDGSVTAFIDQTVPESVAVDAMGNVYAGEVAGRMLKKFVKK